MASRARSRTADVERGERAEIEQRERSLYLRLEDGYSRIEQALAEGKNVARWEDLWLMLLKEYEDVSDSRSALEAA
jgi:hypothetical protein